MACLVCYSSLCRPESKQPVKDVGTHSNTSTAAFTQTGTTATAVVMLLAVLLSYMRAGGNLRGLYAVSCDPGGNPERGLDTIAEDFLVFCKLAVQHGVVPAGWNWSAFLNTAVDMLPYAFEKEDAREKWGGENVFAAMMGGRSLRLTAELVYGEGAMAFGQGVTGGGDSGKAYKAVRRQVNKKWRQLVSSGGVVFSDVGGVAAWKKLRSKLVLPGNPMAGFEDY